MGWIVMKIKQIFRQPLFYLIFPFFCKYYLLLLYLYKLVLQLFFHMNISHDESFSINNLANV